MDSEEGLYPIENDMASDDLLMRCVYQYVS